MKTILVTGATGAIGGAAALELAREGNQVILMGRNAARLHEVKNRITQQTGNSNIDTVVADLSEPASIKQAAQDIRSRYSQLKGLVNTAAIFMKDRKENSLGMEYTFATNHIGPFVLTQELLPLLREGAPARVVTVSAPSTTKVNFDDINGKVKYSSGFMGAFGASKMMNILFTYALARRLQGTGISTSVFHPGLVKSELTKDMPAVLYWLFQSISATPDKAAKMLTRLATDTKFQSSNGTFLNSSGKEIKSSKYSYDTGVQERLWTMSDEMVGG